MEHLKCQEVQSNPRRMRTLGNVVINLGYASTDELFVLRERLRLVQGNLDNDTVIIDAAIDDRFAEPEPPTEQPDADVMRLPGMDQFLEDLAA